MELILSLAVDLLLILVLVLGVYFPRHRRQDLVVAFLIVNIGVFALTVTLGSLAVGAGFGIGLFGVLSIIRLRSSEIDQIDVAYYFGSLVLGLVSALVSIEQPEVALLALLVVVLLYLADNPRFRNRNRHLQMRLDSACYDSSQVIAKLEPILNAHITNVKMIHVDEVQDSTTVEVTYNPKVSVASTIVGEQSTRSV